MLRHSVPPGKGKGGDSKGDRESHMYRCKEVNQVETGVVRIFEGDPKFAL